MSNVYIQSGYAWRPGARLQHLNADQVGHEIAALRDAGNEVQIDQVIAAARHRASAMHAAFTWDDAAAAQKCREDEARYLLRSVIPVVVNPRTEEETPVLQRVFVSRYEDDSSKARIYTMQPVMPVVQRAQGETEHQAIIIAPPSGELLTPEREKARAILVRWADSYEGDPYFAGVVAAIRSLP